jgi:hypothetical protein
MNVVVIILQTILLVIIEKCPGRTNAFNIVLTKNCVNIIIIDIVSKMNKIYI